MLKLNIYNMRRYIINNTHCGMTERSHSGYGEHGNKPMYFRNKREQRQTKIGNMGANLLQVFLHAYFVVSTTKF